MNDVTRMLLIRFIDLFTFSHGGNQNQGGHVTLMQLQPFQVAWQCLDVAVWYFEEILLKLKNKTKQKKKKWKELIKHIDGNDVPVQCEQLAGVGVTLVGWVLYGQ